MSRTSTCLPLLLFLLSCTCVLAQTTDVENIRLRDFDPDDFLIGDAPVPKVLLVGTFHFDYPNLDSHVIGEEDQVDVTTAEKQAEVRELLDYLARFRPNKIVVERRPGSRVNDNYRAYLAGNFELEKDEIHQLAFRLGKRFGIDTLITGDARSLSNTLYDHRDSTVLRPIVDALFAANPDVPDDPLSKRYYELYGLEDKLDTRHSLLEIFQYNNHPHRIRRGHGHYLTFTEDRDADALAIWWYSRNLRIYRNIQRATTSPDDRILVLFGAGHLGILRQQFESSPAYELLDFADLAQRKP